MSTNDETSPLLRATENEDRSHRARMPNGIGYGTDNGEVASTRVSIPSRDSLSSEGVTLSWKNVNVFVESRKQNVCSRLCNCFKQPGDTRKLHILKNVSGVVKEGTLLAILGASGAGKTTLLNVLNQRNIRQLEVVGDIRLNGAELGNEITALSGYVQQDDLFFGRLTVREHLWFHATLRMGKHFTNDERNQRVDDVIQELGLGKCANTQIGIPGKFVGISGGERKRLAFASEVLTNPSLLFCDEPTSGLDSFMAENVVNTLRAMASRGKTVICTIHQPSSQVYALFDMVLLMAEGQVAFMGKTSELPQFFEVLGNQCPPSFNPADYYIHTLAVIPSREKESLEQIQAICDAYENSPQCDELKTELKMLASLEDDKDLNVKVTKRKSRYRVSFLTQFWVLLWRAFTANKREPALFRAKLINTTIVAIIFGLVYLDQTYDQKGIMNINGALFLFQAQMSFGSVFPVVNTFVAEFPVFMREHHNGMYATGLYYITKILAEVPIYIIIPIIFNSIGYWMIGLYKAAAQFLISTGALLLVCNCAVSYGYLLSCLSSNLNLVLALAPMLLVPLMLFGGLFLNSGSIPVYFVWLRYISWFSYSNEILVVNQWRDVRNITCSGSEFESQCFHNGKEVISSLSYKEDNMWLDFVLLSTLLVGFRLLSFIFLYLRARRRD